MISDDTTANQDGTALETQVPETDDAIEQVDTNPQKESSDPQPNEEDAVQANFEEVQLATPEDEENNQNQDDTKAHENQLSELSDIPVKVTAILGSTRIRVSELAKLSTGQVVELDKKVGDQLDIYVNKRLVAHGEVVISDGQLGISLTEIIKSKS